MNSQFIKVSSYDELPVGIKRHKSDEIKVIFICPSCGRESKKSLQQLYNSKKLICGSCKGKETCLEKYGVCNPGAREEQKRKNSRKWTQEEIDTRQKKTEKTLIEKYGSLENARKINAKHGKETILKKYGTLNAFNISDKDGIKRRDKTCLEKYGNKNGFTKETIERIRKTRYRNRYFFEDEFFDSSWEVAFYAYEKSLGKNIKKSQKSIKYDNNHFYFPDFEIDNNLYEIKGTHLWKDGHLYNPYTKKFETEKEKCILENNVTLLFENDLKNAFNYMESKYGKNWSECFHSFKNKEDILNDCLKNDFPGTEKWPANHPIWKCHVYKKLSPFEAWKNKNYLIKAIDNFFYIAKKDKNYYEKVKNYEGLQLRREILNRFTVAKIAPKVTALNENVFAKMVTKDEISNGVYCPMAGFGGIIRGIKKIDNSIEIEAYDINKNFCDWYGWTQRDILAQKIKTDKTVIVCPPFGDKTEIWDGTPENCYYSFEEWCEIIKQQIEAPKYIFFGPEINSDKNRPGLFRKKYGISRKDVSVSSKRS